jgi:hypothetical protein
MVQNQCHAPKMKIPEDEDEEEDAGKNEDKDEDKDDGIDDEAAQH